MTEVLWTKIKLKKEVIIIGTVYRNPDASNYLNYEFFEQLEAETTAKINTYKNATIVLGGDFNARVGEELDYISYENEDYMDEWEKDKTVKLSRIPKRKSKDKILNTAGVKLLRFCKNNELIILNGRTESDSNAEKTFINKNGSSVIDLVMTKAETYLDNKIDIKIGAKTISAHMPVEVLVKVNEKEEYNTNIKQNENGIVVTKFKWDENKNEIFKERKGTEIWKYLKIITEWEIGRENVDAAISKLNHMLEFAGRPMKYEAKTQLIDYKNKWFDKECKKAKQETKRNLRRYRRTNEEKDLQNYVKKKKIFKELCDKKQEEEKIAEIKEIEEAIENKNDKKFWRKVKKKIKRSNYAKNNIKKEEWENHFANLYRMTEKNIEISVEENIRNEVRTDNKDEEKEDDSEEISELNVAETIKSLKNEKSPGIDGIPNEFYKNSSEIYKLIADIFNLMQKKNKWPTEWQTALITTVFKKGDKEKPENYRGISLLPVLSKIYTKLIGEKIQNWSENNKILSEYQAGFRKNRSTIDNIFVMNTLIEQARKRKKPLYACYIDLKTAFDSVSHKKLMQVLKEKNMPSNLMKVVTKIYEKVKASILMPQMMRTNEIMVEKGVRQGCHLSATLFNIYIDGVVEKLKEGNTHPPILLNEEIPILLYADDLVLLSTTEIGLKKALNILENFCEERELTINSNKSNVMLFTKSGKKKTGTIWKLKNETIKETKEYNYLGLLITCNGQWKSCIEERIYKAKLRMKDVISFYYNNKKCSVKTIKKIITSIIEPILLYGAEIWGVEAEAMKTDSIPNDAAKTLLGIKKAAPNAAARREVRLTSTSGKALERSINYLHKIRKYKHNKLVNIALQYQEKNTNEHSWFSKIEKKAEMIKVEIKNDATEIILKKEKNTIKKKIKQWEEDEANKELNKKCSLEAIKLLGITDQEGEEYTKLEERSLRTAWARYRLGTYIYKVPKNIQGIRQCPMCDGAEGVLHWFKDCRAVDELRKTYLVENTTENGNEDDVREIGKFLKEVLQTRDNILK